MKNSTNLQKKESTSVEGVERTRSGIVFSPATDIIETEHAIIVKTDMPGTSENAIDITLENDTLTLQSTVSPPHFDNASLAYREYKTGDYYRAFTLSDHIDREKISARYNDGVLTLTLPKMETAKPRQIKVTAG
jgi:HSP20 family protein